ncbi:type IV pilin protein [Nocardioides cheoyonin]|uniref:type IV pilin protein n=1 Tax=Nocardioides cheoyonin TaxID=3156615 RepID=UPI0032B5A10E
MRLPTPASPPQQRSRLKATGFTLVELLIVIVVIAILAAITLVTYNGIQDRANDAAVQSDLQQFVTAQEIYRLDNDRYAYGNETTASLKFNATKRAYMTNVWNLLICISPDAEDYEILAVSKSGKQFHANPSGVHEYTGDAVWPSLQLASLCATVQNGHGATLSSNGAGYGTSDSGATWGWRAWVGGDS